MTKELAEFLKAATEHCGAQEIEIRYNYSGRNMFGTDTAAVVVDSLTELLVNVIQFVKETDEQRFNQTVFASSTPAVGGIAGEYFADYDEESASWCVFHTDKNTGHAFSSWASEEQAEGDATERNKSDTAQQTQTPSCHGLPDVYDMGKLRTDNMGRSIVIY